MPLNLPIFLTWLRIVLIPLIVGIYYLPASVFSMADKNTLAALVFVLAALTDWLDGFLARKLNQISAFGAFLDPVADKLMVACALLILLSLQRIDVTIAVIVVGREITISALREWMATIGASRNVAVNSLGKIKTVAQMIAIPLLLLNAPYDLLSIQFDKKIGWLLSLELGKILMNIAAVLTVWSMFYYIKLAWPRIADHSSK